MTIWNPEKKHCLKLCAEKDGVDFSSAMSYTYQEKKSALVLLGFANDHGDKHYIVDPLNNGIIKAKKLSFLLKTGAAAKGLQFERDGEEYILRDGEFQIRVKVLEWMFDGEPAEIRICEDGLEFVCFDTPEEREINLHALGVTYGAFSFAINEEPVDARVKLCGERVSVYSEEWGHFIEGYSMPKSYNECIKNTYIG